MLPMQPGEVWWSTADSEWPIVLVSAERPGECGAMHVVSPATEAEKRGYVILTAEAAALATGPFTATGIEVHLDGLPRAGVVRVALPEAGRVYCTWHLTVTRDALVERICTLPAAKMHELGTALRLAAIS